MTEHDLLFATPRQREVVDDDNASLKSIHSLDTDLDILTVTPERLRVPTSDGVEDLLDPLSWSIDSTLSRQLEREIQAELIEEAPPDPLSDLRCTDDLSATTADRGDVLSATITIQACARGSLARWECNAKAARQWAEYYAAIGDYQQAAFFGWVAPAEVANPAQPVAAPAPAKPKRSEAATASARADALVKAGIYANRAGDFVGARRSFLGAYALSQKPTSLVSAANMALRSGDLAAALSEYASARQRARRSLAVASRREALGRLPHASAPAPRRSPYAPSSPAPCPLPPCATHHHLRCYLHSGVPS